LSAYILTTIFFLDEHKEHRMRMLHKILWTLTGKKLCNKTDLFTASLSQSEMLINLMLKLPQML